MPCVPSVATFPPRDLNELRCHYPTNIMKKWSKAKESVATRPAFSTDRLLMFLEANPQAAKRVFNGHALFSLEEGALGEVFFLRWDADSFLTMSMAPEKKRNQAYWPRAHLRHGEMVGYECFADTSCGFESPNVCKHCVVLAANYCLLTNPADKNKILEFMRNIVRPYGGVQPALVPGHIQQKNFRALRTGKGSGDAQEATALGFLT